MNEEIILKGLQPPEKPRVRSRTNLTSIQIDKAQKVIIDQAYNTYINESPTFVSKGQFIEGLCADYLKRNAPLEQPSESDMWDEVQ